MSALKKVLMISPHFPPDTTAGTHRVRLLAPHLPAFGWEPTVLTIEPRCYEGRLDPDLEALVPRSLRVVRCPAWPVRWTRKLKIGDLGLRSMTNLLATSRRLFREHHFDALFITVFPMYPALLGPMIKREFNVPFVLDYIDPWVGAWGDTVGGGVNGTPDWKSRWSRKLGLILEPRAVRAADAITAVSAETYRQIQQRYPKIGPKICAEIPYGGEAADFEALRNHPRPNVYYSANDGDFHLCYVGTLLPLGFETLRSVLQAVVQMKSTHPEFYARLRLRFFGTSNQTSANAPDRVLPVAAELGVADRVTEIAPRIDYLDALTVQVQASALLLMGSSERHYTASKLYPALLARRPLLAAYHEQSTVSKILTGLTESPAIRLVTYNDVERAEQRSTAIHQNLVALMADPNGSAPEVDLNQLHEYSAERLAGTLASVFDQVTANPAKNSSRMTSA